MDKLKLYLSKNWKTTIAGAALGVVGILVSSGNITPDQAHVAALILAGLGFTVAKDGDKTGA